MIEQDVRQAIKLARQGDKAQAQELLRQALKRDPDNVDAWVVLAQVVESRTEAISYMRRAVNLRPGDERARRYLDYLLQQEPPPQPQPAESGGPSNTTIVALAAVAIVLCLGFVLAYAFLWPGAQAAQQITATPLDCEALVAQALELSDQGCQNIGRNQVCYGHSTIEAQLKPGTTAKFDTIGDKIGLDVMEKFVASPLSVDKQEWGIGVFKVEANVPGSLPGQTVTLLIFGSSVDNSSGDMQAFYFSSGLGSIACENVPFDGILVRMPDGTGLSFSANGAEVTMMGTGVMQAQEGQSMSLSLLSGIARIISGGKEQTFSAGQQVTVPLEGREASGPPSEPLSLGGDVAEMACTLTGIGCPGTEIAAISQADIEATLAAVPEPTTTEEATDDPPTQTDTPPTKTSTPGGPTNTPTLTYTPGGPTITPTHTNTPTLTYTPGGPTITPVPPTTPPPTTPPPTTPPPTTPPPTTPPPTTPPPTTPPPTTPPPDPCTLISVTWGGVASGPRNVTFYINNNTGGAITLTDIYDVTWPTSTNVLNRVKLGTSVIWNGSLTPPAHPTPDQGTRTVPVGSTPLVFTFQPDVDPTGYSVTVVFNIGCPKSASG